MTELILPNSRTPMHEDDYEMCNTCAAIMLSGYANLHHDWHKRTGTA